CSSSPEPRHGAAGHGERRFVGRARCGTAACSAHDAREPEEGPGQLRRWFGAAPAGRSSALLLLARGACGGAVLLLARQVGLEASGLAAQLAQVVELRAAGPAAAHDLD